MSGGDQSIIQGGMCNSNPKTTESPGSLEVPYTSPIKLLMEQQARSQEAIQDLQEQLRSFNLFRMEAFRIFATQSRQSTESGYDTRRDQESPGTENDSSSSNRTLPTDMEIVTDNEPVVSLQESDRTMPHLSSQSQSNTSLHTNDVNYKMEVIETQTHTSHSNYPASANMHVTEAKCHTNSGHAVEIHKTGEDSSCSALSSRDSINTNEEEIAQNNIDLDSNAQCSETPILDQILKQMKDNFGSQLSFEAEDADHMDLTIDSLDLTPVTSIESEIPDIMSSFLSPDVATSTLSSPQSGDELLSVLERIAGEAQKLKNELDICKGREISQNKEITSKLQNIKEKESIIQKLNEDKILLNQENNSLKKENATAFEKNRDNLAKIQQQELQIKQLLEKMKQLKILRTDCFTQTNSSEAEYHSVYVQTDDNHFSDAIQQRHLQRSLCSNVSIPGFQMASKISQTPRKTHSDGCIQTDSIEKIDTQEPLDIDRKGILNSLEMCDMQQRLASATLENEILQSKIMRTSKDYVTKITGINITLNECRTELRESRERGIELEEENKDYILQLESLKGKMRHCGMKSQDALHLSSTIKDSIKWINPKQQGSHVEVSHSSDVLGEIETIKVEKPVMTSSPNKQFNLNDFQHPYIVSKDELSPTVDTQEFKQRLDSKLSHDPMTHRLRSSPRSLYPDAETDMKPDRYQSHYTFSPTHAKYPHRLKTASSTIIDRLEEKLRPRSKQSPNNSTNESSTISAADLHTNTSTDNTLRISQLETMDEPLDNLSHESEAKPSPNFPLKEVYERQLEYLKKKFDDELNKSLDFYKPKTNGSYKDLSTRKDHTLATIYKPLQPESVTSSETNIDNLWPTEDHNKHTHESAVLRLKDVGPRQTDISIHDIHSQQMRNDDEAASRSTEASQYLIQSSDDEFWYLPGQKDDSISDANSTLKYENLAIPDTSGYLDEKYSQPLHDIDSNRLRRYSDSKYEEPYRENLYDRDGLGRYSERASEYKESCREKYFQNDEYTRLDSYSHTKARKRSLDQSSHGNVVRNLSHEFDDVDEDLRTTNNSIHDSYNPRETSIERGYHVESVGLTPYGFNYDVKRYSSSKRDVQEEPKRVESMYNFGDSYNHTELRPMRDTKIPYYNDLGSEIPTRTFNDDRFVRQDILSNTTSRRTSQYCDDHGDYLNNFDYATDSDVTVKSYDILSEPIRHPFTSSSTVTTEDGLPFDQIRHYPSHDNLFELLKSGMAY